jgi:hypothetical protein
MAILRTVAPLPVDEMPLNILFDDVLVSILTLSAAPEEMAIIPGLPFSLAAMKTPPLLLPGVRCWSPPCRSRLNAVGCRLKIDAVGGQDHAAGNRHGRRNYRRPGYRFPRPPRFSKSRRQTFYKARIAGNNATK